jgi:bifunctional UDP-N-acetylglucosamine pyrophosphorylase/glucosamine-1-phosphate N-acetyltransferase
MIEHPMQCNSLILAAGLGTRMKSRIPKVLHSLVGRPMLEWPITACRAAVNEPPYVVIGPEWNEEQRGLFPEIRWIEQADRLGTGHAVLQARPVLKDQGELVLVVNADLPLTRSESLKALIDAQEANDGPFTLLTAISTESRGFGRIERDDDGRVKSIIEEAHASPDQLAIQELNVGAYCFKADWLWAHIEELPISAKGEFYLTDLVQLAYEAGAQIASVTIQTLDEMIGVNTRVHLAEAEGALRRRILEHWMLEGVTIPDPTSTYVGADVRIGQDTILMPNTHLAGGTSVGEDCVLGPNSFIEDTTIGDRCTVHSSVLEGATLEQEVVIGPYAHLRTGAYLEQGVHMGNFGEVKNSRLRSGVKMGHFSYIGDATIGAETNIGAGTITCNFDGEKKNFTEIGENAFIGSDTMLVAPVRIGNGARTGAGSVVTRDVPDDSVAVGNPARVIRGTGKDRDA